MRRAAVLPIIAVLFVAALMGVLPRAQGFSPRQSGRSPASTCAVRDAMIPMREGVGLHVEIFTPKEQQGPLPIIMSRTRYGNWLDTLNRPWILNRVQIQLKYVLDAASVVCSAAGSVDSVPGGAGERPDREGSMNKKNRADKKRAPERSQARAAKTEDSPVVLTDGDLDKVSGGVSRIPTTHGSDAGRAGGTHSSKTGGRTQ